MTHIVQGPISANRATFIEIAHFADDRSDATGTQARGTAPNQLRQRSEELSLSQSGLEGEKVIEDADDHEKFIGGITENVKLEINISDPRRCYGYLSMRDKKAVSITYGFSIL